MSQTSNLQRFIRLMVYILAVVAVAGIVMLLQSKNIIYKNTVSTATSQSVELEPVNPFPVGVNAFTREIQNDPGLIPFFESNVASNPQSKHKWWNQVAAVFANQAWFQTLASPVGRIVVVWPGERKEEVAKHIGDILRWTAADRAEFQELINEQSPILSDGKYFPGQYVTHRYATPRDMAELLSEEFTAEIGNRYSEEVAAQVPIEDALIIASLLEREASDFENMREVSGVIWNRLFINMPLQLDATLQYVRASNGTEEQWWPAVKSADKFLESPYNTYANKGLPPGPIANPSVEAVLAALNPAQTDCLYYFHDSNADYYCSVTYEEHVSKLKALYGRGS